MASGDIINWYEQHFGVDWTQFETEQDAVDFMEANASGPRAHGLINAVTGSKFQGGDSFNDRIVDVIGGENQRLLTEFESDILAFDDIESVEAVSITRAILQGEADIIKKSRIQDIKTVEEGEDEQLVFEELKQEILDVQVDGISDIRDFSPDADTGSFISQLEAARLNVETNQNRLTRPHFNTLNNLINEKAT